VNNHQLQSILGTNVVELNFVRRHPKLGYSNIAGMFGTTNPALLNSPFGFQVIHFRPPLGVGMGYDYKSKNLCVIFDMFRQDYRVFGAEQVDIHKQWPLTNEEEIVAFEKYFYDYIINMSEDAKEKFIGFVSIVPVKPKPPVTSIAKSINKAAASFRKPPKVNKNQNWVKAAYASVAKGAKAWFNKYFGRK